MNRGSTAMSTLYIILLDIHVLFGLLWFLSLVILTLSISKSIKTASPVKELENEVVFSRSTGGLAIIFGIVLALTLEDSGNRHLFTGSAGVVLMAAIALAVTAYVFVGEGFLFRKINGVIRNDTDHYSRVLGLDKKIRMVSVAETILVLLVIVLMVFSASL